MKDSSYTVSVAYIHTLLDYLNHKEIDIQPIISKHGIEPSTLEQPQKRISGKIFSSLYNEAELIMNDPDLGLHIGEHFKPGYFGVLGYIFMNCPHVRELLDRFLRYRHLVHDIGHVNLLASPEGTYLVWEIFGELPSRHWFEHVVSVWVHYFRWVVGKPLNLTRVFFQHKQPENISEHQRVFSCPIDFNQEKTGVLFPEAYLDLPLRQADPDILRQLDHYAEVLAVKFQNETGMMGDIKTYIAKMLQVGEVSLEKVAEHLNLNPRTLQRKLKKLDLTYTNLLDSTRRQLALQYIKNELIELVEIAFLLGYSEQSAFQSAFKRWTGKTPGQYRQNLTGSIK